MEQNLTFIYQLARSCRNVEEFDRLLRELHLRERIFSSEYARATMVALKKEDIFTTPKKGKYKLRAEYQRSVDAMRTLFFPDERVKLLGVKVTVGQRSAFGNYILRDMKGYKKSNG